MESTPDHTASKGAAQLQVAQVSFPGTEPEGLRDGQRASEDNDMSGLEIVKWGLKWGQSLVSHSWLFSFYPQDK